MNRLTRAIIIAMLLGIATGQGIRWYTPVQPEEFASNITLITDVFLRLINMIIAPLVFTTLTVGIAKMGDTTTVGRIGIKTLLWFMMASMMSLILGLVMVTILSPGVGLHLDIPSSSLASGVDAQALSFRDFVIHAVPRSVIEAMASNQILQIVVFSLFFGLAAAAIGAPAYPVIDMLKSVSEIMLKVTAYVMNFAPFAVFAAISAMVAKEGMGILSTYGAFMGQFYFSLSILWGVLLLMGALMLGRRVFTLFRMIREPILLAFSTASSESAYPKTLESLSAFGTPKRISSFVLPMGYSFNLDGSMMYCTFAVMFIAQAYGIELTMAQQVTMLLILMVTSKGMAGVPRASLVVIAATLHQFHIPDAGILLLLGIDHFLDMGRSATNVLGNAIAAGVVAKSEEGNEAPLEENVA
ncbi:dicarboxylate/amino acid:cation symporter [Vibrio metschnikovii]|uniref:dicarboxylate/amino acid:cation symporter n=1 Tax=Vibrio metschnikovii TaxID=28172 RepID=UPI001C9B44B6|nr:dicarboxylate/amino acid:cation symporter [Vibrio metschnikovii]